ncbi:potassium/proton antiporter membrane subunit, CPA2 family [Desulfurobacterium pacificum]|uniref:Potassium/proton antiporter membrane subunit, CPA2 family n=1 Tax=Desulfurobacterium pacificum TaxID=240166 RepID=A0ABY1NUJ5_9BACT|nr:cation:proton antiporter [Desulfurobacterium pacificum]SMP18713.1 potassium/proton antiporter membrane subunit, CPA2 family [Desulfurobacterium pacificum]
MEAILTHLTIFLTALLFSYILSKKTGIPVIPIYIVAGILISTIAHIHEAHIFETLGVILLLFYIGLEFSVAELEKNLKNILSVGVTDLVLNVTPLFVVAKLLGFDNFTSFVLSIILYPSSSAIISKLLIDYRKLANPEVDPVLSILVFEDIAAAIFLALISNLSSTNSSPTASLAITFKIFLFIFIAFIIVKNTNKLIDIAFHRLGTSSEFVVLLTGSLMFLIIEATLGFGLSESIGAFLAGTLFAESSFKHQVESVVIPYRDLLGSLFFLSFGLSIDPKIFSVEIIPLLTLLLILSFATKILTGIAAAKLYGLKLKRGVSAGIMLLPRGEFSILVAASTPKLLPLTALYVLTSSIIGSITLKESDKLLSVIFRKKKKRKSKLTRSQLLGE